MATRCHQKYIIKMDIPNPRCRLCDKEQETNQHIISACTQLAPTAYLNRHNNMGKELHLAVTQRLNLKTGKTPGYKHQPLSLVENEHYKVYWDTLIRTDREVQHNKPDMIVLDKNSKSAIIIDFSVPLDENLGKAYKDKIMRYRPLADEVRDLWNLRKVEIKPFIISANGLVHVKVTKHLEELSISRHICGLMQKAVILGTTAIVRRTLTP